MPAASASLEPCWDCCSSRMTARAKACASTSETLVVGAGVAGAGANAGAGGATGAGAATRAGICGDRIWRGCIWGGIWGGMGRIIGAGAGRTASVAATGGWAGGWAGAGTGAGADTGAETGADAGSGATATDAGGATRTVGSASARLACVGIAPIDTFSAGVVPAALAGAACWGAESPAAIAVDASSSDGP